jgi:hypothetical protein
MSTISAKWGDRGRKILVSDQPRKKSEAFSEKLKQKGLGGVT